MAKHKFKSGNQLSSRSILIWRIVQTLVWLVGVFILFNLLFFPTIGIHLFWNVLIPVAPALLVLGVGIWRNVCPMASTALFPRHMGFSKRKKLRLKQVGILNLVAVIALLLIAPLRHAIFNNNGLATAILIVSLALIAVISGYFFEWKSAWCSGLCPIHPVEKLYGVSNRLELPNAHCGNCHRCVTPCPDTTPEIHPLSSKKTIYHKISGFIMVAAFPGFVWGWFQVPDYAKGVDMEQFLMIYAYPVLGILVSSLLFLLLKNFIQQKTLIAISAATSVSCYYWFRIPALFGFGAFPGDGMLIDLTSILPRWSMLAIVLVLTFFFFYWFVFSQQSKTSWVVRPNYALSKK